MKVPADSPITVRVASYNVEFSRSATPEQIGEMFKPYNLDLIGFDEAINTIEAAGMRPTWKDLSIDLTKQFTWNVQNPKRSLGVIDHILYNTSSGAKASDGGIIELKTPLSDHKPIWAEIIFPRNL